MPLTPETQIVRNESILGSVLSEEAVLMNIEQGSYHGLDKVGAEIWEMAETPVALGHVIDTLGARYKVTPEQCQTDVIAFVDALITRDIVIAVSDT